MGWEDKAREARGVGSSRSWSEREEEQGGGSWGVPSANQGGGAAAPGVTH